MKKNIIFITILMLILTATGLYYFVEFISASNTKRDLQSLKENSLIFIDIISPEIKTSLEKVDDIALLYNIERLSKLNNISEVFILNNDLEIQIHNDSSKWNKKYESNEYKKAVETKSKLVQTLPNNKYLYSLPVKENATLCVQINSNNVFALNNMFKIKMFVVLGVFVIILTLILFNLLKFFMLKSFYKQKKLLTLNNFTKRTIYSELIDMIKKDSLQENSSIQNEELEQLKELVNISLNKNKINEEDVFAILDTNANIICCKDKDNIIFNKTDNNIHILNATKNVSVINTVSKIMENPQSVQNENFSTSNMNIDINSIVKDGKFLGITILSKFVGI